MALPDGGLLGVITGQRSRQLKLQRLAAANDRLSVAERCALCDVRAPSLTHKAANRMGVNERQAIAERRQIRALLGEAQQLLQTMK
jgi:hypothetical protein